MTKRMVRGFAKCSSMSNWRPESSGVASYGAVQPGMVALDCDVLELHVARGSTLDGLMLALLKGLTGRA